MSTKEYRLNYYKNHSEERKKYQKEYFAKNKEKIQAKNYRLNKNYRKMNRKRFDSFELWSLETCKFCGNRVIPGYGVSDITWSAVIGKEICVCLPCFDREAQKKNIDYKILNVFWVSWKDV